MLSGKWGKFFNELKFPFKVVPLQSILLLKDCDLIKTLHYKHQSPSHSLYTKRQWTGAIISALAFSTFCLWGWKVERVILLQAPKWKLLFDYCVLMSHIRNGAKDWKGKSIKPLQVLSYLRSPGLWTSTLSPSYAHAYFPVTPSATVTDAVEIHRWRFRFTMISSSPSSVSLFWPMIQNSGQHAFYLLGVFAIAIRIKILISDQHSARK